MHNGLRTLKAQMNRERRQRGRRKLLLSALSLFVLLGTTSGMLLPAFTQEKTAYCGMEEHVHGEDCYDTVLVCTEEETPGHVHDESCYVSRPVLICEQEETEGHVHDAACYEQTQRLICPMEESEQHSHGEDCFEMVDRLVCLLEEREGHVHTEACYSENKQLVCQLPETEGHTHTESCYDRRLKCELPEHEHSLACYSNPDATESETVWESSIPLFADETPTERLLKIAASQLGYHESAENYRVHDDGRVQGWTRYGAWYGEPYGDWCAMFVSFCLYYAGIDESVMPYSKDCIQWIDALKERGQYAEAQEQLPAPGDLAFFDLDHNGMTDHVGLVWRVDAERSSLEIIDGNYADDVETRSYAVDDTVILGYGLLPERSRAGEQQTEENAPDDPPQPEAPVEADLLSYPAQSFRAELGELLITVEADEGAFPEGTAMRACAVPEEQVLEAVSGAVDGQVLWVEAVDISFYNEIGEEIQPLLPIRVSIVSDQITESASEETEVVHVNAAGAAQVVDQTDVSEHAALNSVAFEADSFSIYAVVRTAIEKRILSDEGYSYLISVTYGPESGIPDGAELAVSEILQNSEAIAGAVEYEKYLALTGDFFGTQSDLIGYARFFDISIVKDGEELQPAAGSTVNVTIELEDSPCDRLCVLHFGEEPEIVESTSEEGSIVFETSGFSVYAIVDAPEPAGDGGWNKISAADEILSKGSNGFLIHHIDGYYFTNENYTISNSRTGIKKTEPKTSSPDEALRKGAAYYFFEPAAGSGDQFRAYCFDGETKLYVRQNSNSLSLTTEENATVFTVSPFPGETDTFRVAGNNGYYWNMQGGIKGHSFAAYNVANDENARIQFEYLEQDPYGLDGKTYGIAYHDDNVTAAALTAEEQQSGGQTRLKGTDLVMKPDLYSNNGILLVAPDSDIHFWSFQSVGANRYYITTSVEGNTKYLSISGGNVQLLDEPDEVSSVISATPGTGEYAGKWRFTVNGYSLNLPKKTEDGFNAIKNEAATVWMNLVEQTELDDDAFTPYTARKVSVSDSENVYTGQQVILYTRIWNETAKKYEFYVVDQDGSLIRAYDTGDTVQWIGSKANTALWEFSEGMDDGNPTFYYYLRNTSSNSFLVPRASTGQILYESPLPDGTLDFNASVNLDGRRFGENYTDIISWDDEYYAYSGLKTENGRVVACPLSEAEDFYFAVVHTVDPDDELTTVATVDNTQHGITMKMIDFNNPVVGGRDSVQHGFFGNRDTQKHDPGLLTTELDPVSGYPSTTSLTGHTDPLSNLFTAMTDVNHLFIQSIYNESGYYEYDSTQNFAHLNGNGDFTVYNQLASIGSYIQPTRTHGQFMPYNDIEPGRYSYDANGNLILNTTDVNANELSDLDPRKGEKLHNIPLADADYFFGMELSAEFTQTADGLDAWGHDIIFEFSGDDDFWLYVDGELVLDLGGVRPAMTGSVNFRTGEVVNGGKKTTLYQLFESNYRARGCSETEIAERLAERFELNEEGNYVFKDFSNHKMHMFYMERGAGASNLHLRFNLASVIPGTIELSKKLSGTDSPSNSLIEFPYQIWYRTTGDGPYQLLGQESGDAGKVTYKNSTRSVKYLSGFTPSGAAQEYEHVFFLKPGETAVVDLPEGTRNYYIVECGIDPNVIDQVKVNEDVLSPSENGSRSDYASAPASMEDRPGVEFDNHVSENAIRTLTITKKLYDSDGNTVLHPPADSTCFSFRLYLGSENSDPNALPLADRYPYFVKNGDGYYCRWDVGTKSFVPLPYDTFDALKAYLASLSPNEREAIAFSSSMNGSISRIPADHSVEVRELISGTQWKVEERDYEIPKGYKLRLDDGYQRTDTDPVLNTHDQPISGTIQADSDPKLLVSNQKGWGLTVQKEWSDKDFMDSHDPIYFGVFIIEGTEEQPSYRLVPGTVHQMSAKEKSIYYFFDNLENGVPFDRYRFFELNVTNPVVDENGVVTGYDSISLIPEGGTLTVNAKKTGADTSGSYTYSVHYDKGEQTQTNQNVRTDTVTNSRPGIRLLKTNWTGDPLGGAVFTLKDAQGKDVGLNSYTSRAEDGLITIAYLDEGSYSLSEVFAPNGYRGLEEPITITVVNDEENLDPVITVGPESYGSFFTVTQAQNGQMASITIKNRTASLRAVKMDAGTGDPLSNAVFAIYRALRDAGGNLIPDINPYRSALTSGADGVIPDISFDDLPPGQYFLRETKAPSGYNTLKTDILLTISPTRAVSISGVDERMASLEESGEGDVLITLRLNNSRSKAVRLLKKAYDSDTVLSGASFALYTEAQSGGAYPPSGVEPLMTGVTDSDGLLSLGILDNGRYCLYETAAPTGYQKLIGPIVLSVSDSVSAMEGSSLLPCESETADGLWTVTVFNSSGYELPQTGGHGAMPFRLGGTALILTGLLYRFRKRRKRGRGDASL